eukprot:3276201-Amphidinium_carterae.1
MTVSVRPYAMSTLRPKNPNMTQHCAEATTEAHVRFPSDLWLDDNYPLDGVEVDLVIRPLAQQNGNK